MSGAHHHSVAPKCRHCLLLVAALLAACGEEVQPEPAVTYHRDIRPLIEANCLSCHNTGGMAPFALETWEDVERYAQLVVGMVEARVMPPWNPDAECREYQHSRRLSDEDVDTFVAWQDEGYAEGRESDYVAVEQPAIEVTEPDLLLDGGVAYRPDRERADDYRCLPLTQEFAEDTFLTGVDVLPGVRSVVHHGVVFLVEPSAVRDMERLDESEEGPGYTCFGGARAGSSTIIAGWAPGSVPQRFPDGAAFVIPTGARLVLQVHYNVLALAEDDATPSDVTRVALWTLPPGEFPDYEVKMLAYPDLRMSVAAGDAEGVNQHDFVFPFDGQIISTFPHMHTRGQHIRAELIRQDGESECLIDIPDWDFDWQQTYQLQPDDLVPVRAGDTMRLTCVHDNSASNQPVINGERIEPTELQWGEGTYDEMCVDFVSVMVPYGQQVRLCSQFADCWRECDSADWGCFFDCGIMNGVLCSSCLGNAYGACVPRHEDCVDRGIEVYQCMAACEDPIPCLVGVCDEPASALLGCMAAPLAAGACNADLAACGIDL